MAGALACLLAIGSTFAASGSGSSGTDSAVPTGTLTVDRDLLRVGTKSQLTWNISYPAPNVTSVIDIVTPNTVKPKQDLTMKVRVLGASFQQTTTIFLPVEVMVSKNNSAWSRVFYGLQTSVVPSLVVYSTPVKKNDLINLGGRGYRDNAWLPLYNTASSTKNLVMLKNGDTVPSEVPALNGLSIESFLKPYMDTNTKKVKIGDRDLIYLMELGQTDPNNSGFDLQDLVVLVTFE